MLTYDPRTISAQVYQNLDNLKQNTQDSREQKEQKSQAVELYTYVATWGLLRLKAEEVALSQKSKQDVVKCFFKTLGKVAFPQEANAGEANAGEANAGEANAGEANPLLGQAGLTYLTEIDASEYLGLTSLALQVAREFAFWAEAVYPDGQTTQQPPTDTQ